MNMPVIWKSKDGQVYTIQRGYPNSMTDSHLHNALAYMKRRLIEAEKDYQTAERGAGYIGCAEHGESDSDIAYDDYLTGALNALIKVENTIKLLEEETRKRVSEDSYGDFPEDDPAFGWRIS